MSAIRSLPLAFLLVSAALLHAQEIKYLDIRSIQQRTELRHPPAPSVDCDGNGHCVGGGGGSVSVGDGAPDIRDPHALGVYLLSVAPADIDPSQPFEAEFRVLNTGVAPIELPISPHLADLQPGDDAASFSYFSLALEVHTDGKRNVEMPFGGWVELYGSPDQEGTMLTLKPGQWIRVTANVKFAKWPPAGDCRVRGQFWMRRNTYYPHPGGSSTQSENLYPNRTPTPAIPVHFLKANPSRRNN